MGSDESHFNVSLIVRDKVTRQCPQTTTFEEKGEKKDNNNNNNNSYIAQYPVTIDDGRERWKWTVQEEAVISDYVLL